MHLQQSQQFKPSTLKRKARSIIPQRKRSKFTPIINNCITKDHSDDSDDLKSVEEADSSSSSCFPSEISTEVTSLPSSQLHGADIDGGSGGGMSMRVVNRSYYRRRGREVGVVEKSGVEVVGGEVEVSESSCVESFSGVNKSFGFVSKLIGRNLSRVGVSSSGSGGVISKRGGVDDGFEAVNGEDEAEVSESSCFESISTETKNRGVIVDDRKLFIGEVSGSSCIDSYSGANGVATKRVEVSDDVSVTLPESKLVAVTEATYVVDTSAKYGGEDEADSDYYDLSCSEYYDSADSVSEDNDTTFSNIESEVLPKDQIQTVSVSDDEYMSLSDDYYDYESSQTDFSQGDDGSPPLYFNLYQQNTQQLLCLPSSFSSSNNVTPINGDVATNKEYLDEFTLLKFEEEENEESYNKLRIRERKIVIKNYGKDYVKSSEFGDLVLQQRLLMVNWIVEQSNKKELHPETIFLGVSLLDRFLTQSFFNNKRKLQVLGIACLTLATRIEENQSLNSIRQLAFHVGSNSYGRSEVVAMEWLVQEVLKFQCFLPTTYNFLGFYLKAAKADAQVEKKAKYLAMLSLLDNDRLSYWPSTVAAGLVILASLAANKDSSCQWVMETHVRTKNDDLSECIQSLDWLVKYVC